MPMYLYPSRSQPELLNDILNTLFDSFIWEVENEKQLVHDTQFFFKVVLECTQFLKENFFKKNEFMNDD